MNDQTTNTRQPIETLTVGDHYGDNQGVHEVVHTLSTTRPGERREITLTLNPLGPGRPWLLRHFEGTPVAVASPDEIAEYKDLARRQALAFALHQLATDIVEKRLPVTARLFDAAPGVLRSRADLERWAEYLGTEIKLSGRTPIVTASRPVADGLALHFHTQTAPDPEPEPAPEPTYRVTFDLKAGVEAITVPTDTTIAELANTIRRALLAAELIDAGHEVSVTIDDDDDAVLVTPGEVVVRADGHVVERGSVTKLAEA